MEFALLTLTGLLGLLAVLFVWFVFRADGDVTLLWCEKFCGKTELHGKVVWITGASSGIGECLCYDCARLGAKLIISGTSIEKLHRVKQKCLALMAESDILVLPFLMQDFSTHSECVEKAINHFGHIDILINNAGVSQRAKFVDIDLEVDRELFDVNVFGAVNLTRKVLKHFLERNSGHIVVNSSMAGKLGAPFSSSYTASKHALHGYFEALRTELASTKIKVTIVCPGPVYSSLRSRCVTGKPNEVFDEQQSPTDKKMRTERCSELMVVALLNQLDECWICFQPLLLLFYLAQYTPTFFRKVIVAHFFTAEKAEAYRSGRR